MFIGIRKSIFNLNKVITIEKLSPTKVVFYYIQGSTRIDAYNSDQFIDKITDFIIDCGKGNCSFIDLTEYTMEEDEGKGEIPW